MQVTITVELGNLGLRTMLLRRLGLPADAEPERVRSAYRALARRTHPDAGGSAEEFRKVHAAYKTLKDNGWA